MHVLARRVFFGLLLLGTTGPVVLADSAGDNREHAIPGHHIEAMVGVAYNDGKTGAFTGLEYEYRFSELIGVGAFADTTFGGFDLAAFGAVANFHPVGGWKFLSGVGIERKVGGDKNKTLLRVGGGYEFHVGNGTIAPMMAYDFLEDTKDVVYVGIAIGFGF